MGYPGRKYRLETAQPLPGQGYSQASVPLSPQGPYGEVMSVPLGAHPGQSQGSATISPQGPYGEHMSVPLGAQPGYSQPPNQNHYYNQPYNPQAGNHNSQMPGYAYMSGGISMLGNGHMPSPGGMPMPGGMPTSDSKHPMPGPGMPMPGGYPYSDNMCNAPPPPPYSGQPHFGSKPSFPPSPQNQNGYNHQPPSFQPIPSSQPVPSQIGSSVSLSNFSGRKKAVLIGINYYGTKAELRGCINDVKNVQDFICRHYGFSTNNMVILTDDQKNNPTRMPTRKNMLQAMQWLVSDARPNDSLFFHFSGHGSQREDKDGDEDDGFDETICPVDYARAGEIVDDELNAIMVRPLPQGCRLTAIFDCCHSGTALDLPYLYDDNGNLIAYSPEKASKKVVGDLTKNFMMGDMVGALMSLKKTFGKPSGKNAQKISQQTKGTLADVIMFSGCKDSQTSADAHEKGVGHTGAMSFALIKVLSNNPHGLSYIQLLSQMRGILKAKYTQVPQLSSGRPMDMKSVFNM